MTNNAVFIIKVNVEERAGLFQASSPNLPGLHICGTTQEQTCATVIRAVKALFKHNRNMNVDVIPATSDEDNFPQLKGPCDQFVVQRLAA